jgi:hypothetical protein
MKLRYISAIAVAALMGVTTLPLATAATPTVSATVKAQLIYLIQEEKLARDVYAALAKSTSINKFANITKSEQTHVDQLRVVFKTYGIKDPTVTLKVGVFVDKKLTALYKTLMTKGALSNADAIAVGVFHKAFSRTDGAYEFPFEAIEIVFVAGCIGNGLDFLFVDPDESSFRSGAAVAATCALKG